MQSAVNIDNEIISFAYKFAYHLCGNRKVAEKLTELAIIAHYNQVHDDNLLLLIDIWQEFLKYYNFIKFQEGTGVQKILLNLPAQLRCGVIQRYI